MHHFENCVVIELSRIYRFELFSHYNNSAKISTCYCSLLSTYPFPLVLLDKKVPKLALPCLQHYDLFRDSVPINLKGDPQFNALLHLNDMRSHI